MTEDRRKQWIAVFDWFQRQNETPELSSLWHMLNELLQQERSGQDLRGPNDIANDPEFEKFMQALDRAFSKKPKPPED